MGRVDMLGYALLTRRLRQFLGRQKETVPVVGGMRRDARY